MAKAGGRKKLPKEIAVINADNCTGCESCLEVCPVDCIAKVAGESISVLQSWCEIDVERCVGCEVCVAIPTKKTDPYLLTVCPWDAIEMVPTVMAAQAVASKGGPPGYMLQHWDRLVVPAQRMSELAAEQANSR
ncbi:MAG: 4Fe-4S dicluster domain-containing protein [Planctomycetes bacterium]|nr:4Fe-4S dicluster domain-containing protein [Planctomycetota bacterium]